MTQDLKSDREHLLEALKRDPLHEEISERRLLRLVEVVMGRLSSVTVVAENLCDPHNVSAIVRTAEGFGLDRVHVVEQPNPYRRHRQIVRGADRWLHIERHKSLSRCLGGLAAKGFVSAAADIGPGTVPLNELPVDKPIALVLGSEHDGLSPRAKAQADLRFTIPMAGFTGSFNVSVSAAVALYDLGTRRRAYLEREGDLELDEMTERVLAWLEKAIKRKGGRPLRTKDGRPLRTTA